MPHKAGQGNKVLLTLQDVWSPVSIICSVKLNRFLVTSLVGTWRMADRTRNLGKTGKSGLSRRSCLVEGGWICPVDNKNFLRFKQENDTVR